MDSTSEHEQSSELEKPPTLVAESGGRGKSIGTDIASIAMATVADDKSAKMPVLQPNVSLVGTRTKSGRIHKPARNFNTDEYVVPTLIKRRIPNNSRTTVVPPPVAVSKPVLEPTPASTASTSTIPATTSASELDEIRSRLDKKFPKAATDDEETPFTYIIDVCFKENDKNPNLSVADIHTKVKESHKNWTKGPYKLRDDEIKFVQECIVKPEWSRISVKDWRVLAEALKDRMFRMRKRFAKGGRYNKGRVRGKVDSKKPSTVTRQKGKDSQGVNSEEELGDSDEDEETMDWETLAQMDDSSTHSSRLSTRSKDPGTSKTLGGSKTSSVTNDADFDLSLGSVGIDDFAGEGLKEEMFDDLENALVNESKNKVGNSMVDALHATLQKDGGPEFDPSQYEPPALEKDGAIFALDDMDADPTSCNFFENIEEPAFGNADTPTELTEETFEDLEEQDEDMEEKEVAEDFPEEKVDLDSVEIEESSGAFKVPPGSSRDFTSLGSTMISIKTALMCALKISEDFLPSSHEKYMDRLEESEKYRHEELDDIRKKLNMKPSAMAAKRKMLAEGDVSKKPKVALKVMNGTDKPKPLPYLRSAYAKCRKFMEDEITVIEKLGCKKILAAGRVIDIDYETYIKESDVEIPFDDASGVMPALPPPTASNCHAPCCRLGCICTSISEDMPPRKHCGRPKCFFECNCQNILFNSNDDGDIRSRLRPRVSLLNWRAESTEKEKEPMTSYRQMERGTHFIRSMRRTPSQPERLRREFVLDGKVVDRTAKSAKERMRTKALLQSSHRRIMAKPEGHHRFMRIVPPKVEQKPKVSIEQLKKKCTPMSIDVEHINVAAPSKSPASKPASPQKSEVLPPRAAIAPPGSKLSVKDIEEIKSIIQEMTEDCQLLIMDQQIGFFSWATGMIHPKVVMYQVMRGDDIRAPWLYLPIPPPGYSWICHHLVSSFEKSDYVYIPEIKCCIPSQALKVNMNSAFMKKKPVVFDVKAEGTPPGMGKIYFFPDLPKVLVCGPFKTDQTTVNPRDIGNADKIANALQHMEKLRVLQRFGDERSWKRFTSAPTIFPIKKRTDNETNLPEEQSKHLFAQLFSDIVGATPAKKLTPSSQFRQPMLPPPAKVKKFDWSDAVKFVGLGNTGSITASSTNTTESRTLNDLINL